MVSGTVGTCGVCGKPGSVHVTEVLDGRKTSRSFCVEHAPQGMRDRMPFGPHRTPAEEVGFLRQQLAKLDLQVSDPAQRAEFKAELERLITEIEAGRHRLGDAQ